MEKYLFNIFKTQFNSFSFSTLLLSESNVCFINLSKNKLNESVFSFFFDFIELSYSFKKSENAILKSSIFQ
jgi:hypothetical protein